MKTIHITIAMLMAISGKLFAQQSTQTFSKFDFLPGEKVIFYDDFTSENVGDFPGQWLTNGSGEIVTAPKLPGRWFKMTKMGYYIPEVKESFTDNFTIEFDFVPMNNANSETMFGFSIYLVNGSLSEPGGGGEPGEAGFQISLDYDNVVWKNWSIISEQRFNGTVTYPFKSNEKYHMALWVQKQRVRFYANENKVLDVPRAIPAGIKPTVFRFDTRDEAIPLIGNFRMAAGLADMRSHLLKDGKIISYGISFDVNSDKLKSESYSTLKEITDILKENPAIRIKVVGHTDADGDDASNLSLSKRRAESVKNELVTKFGVDAARLETDGKGESEPIADNNSSVNKAKNRRVEFINLKNSPAASLPQASAVAALTDVDGNAYKTIIIGKQVWMAENLKTTRLTDGTKISNVSGNEEFNAMRTPAFSWYKNDTLNKKKYGGLYNWFAVKTVKVCPSGWHVTSDAEWMELEMTLGMTKDDATMVGDRGTDQGARLKSTTGWDPRDKVIRPSGFAALPGGIRADDGSFMNANDERMSFRHGTCFWTSTKRGDPKRPDAEESYFRSLQNGVNTIQKNICSDYRGHSIRCVKD